MLSQNPQFAEKTIRFVANLNKGDEIDASLGVRPKRCRVTRSPQLEAGKVRLFVASVTQPWRTAVVTYQMGTSVPTYLERFRTWYELQQEALISQVLEVLSPEDGYLTCRQILDRLRLYHPDRSFNAQRVQIILRDLARDNKLKVKASRVMLYSLPLPATLGLPVVELAGKRSERVGWVIAWKDTRNGEQPIVQWLEPGYPCTLSSEELLEPLKDRFQLQQIEFAKLRLAGEPPPHPIPESLLLSLYTTMRERRLTNHHPVLVEVAALIGIDSSHPTRPDVLTVKERNQVLDYLALHYPNWQKGGFC